MEGGESKNIYLDGEEASITADENGTITVEANNDSFNAALDVYSDGTAGMVIDTNNEQHEYVVQINELVVETNKVDIKVYENNELITTYKIIHLINMQPQGTYDLIIIAAISMVIDHVGVVIVANFLIAKGYTKFDMLYNLKGIDYSSSIAILFKLYWIMRIIGRIAFPLYCFLIVEGYIHTKRIRAYILRIAIGAIISEVAYDFTFYYTVIDNKHQNVLFTLLIGLVLIYIIDNINNEFSNHYIKYILYGSSIL